MGFVGKVLANMEGVQNYYIVGMFIFIVLFVIIVVRTLRMPKKDLIQIKTSIFENGELESKQSS